MALVGCCSGLCSCGVLVSLSTVAYPTDLRGTAASAANRVALGVDDVARADRALKGIAGKRLTYLITEMGPIRDANKK